MNHESPCWTYKLSLRKATHKHQALAGVKMIEPKTPLVGVVLFPKII